MSVYVYIIFDFPVTYWNASVVCQSECAFLHKTVNMVVYFVRMMKISTEKESAQVVPRKNERIQIYQHQSYTEQSSYNSRLHINVITYWYSSFQNLKWGYFWFGSKLTGQIHYRCSIRKYPYFAIKHILYSFIQLFYEISI